MDRDTVVNDIARNLQGSIGFSEHSMPEVRQALENAWASALVDQPTKADRQVLEKVSFNDGIEAGRRIGMEVIRNNTTEGSKQRIMASDLTVRCDEARHKFD